jgi:CBS domain-containing protein
MRAIEGVRKELVTVSPDDTLGHVARVMADRAVGTVVIVEAGRATGIATDRDLVTRGLARGNVDGRIDSVMSTDLVVADADADLHEVVRTFGTHAVRRVVLLRGGAPVGLLSVDDLVVDLVADLTALLTPVTAEVLFGQHDAPTPARVGDGSTR